MEMTSWPGEERQKAYARQQATVADLGQRALMGTSLSTLLDNAVALVAHTLDVEFCRVMELLPGGKTMLLRAGVGWREGLVGHVTVGAEAAGCQSYYTLACIEPVIVHDYNTETRFSIPPLLQEHGAVSGLSVVIGGQGRRQPFGVLGVHTRQRRDFTEDDIHFLQAIANVLAAAIERQQAETQLRESERRFQRMVANAPGMVYQFVLHPDGSVAFPYVSEGCREVCGLEPEEVQADAARALDMIHPQDRPLFDRAVAESAASLQPKKWEGRILLPTGEQKWLQLASRPERQANGDVLWDGLLIDITERKRAEHVSHGLTTALTRQLSALTARPELDTFLGQVLAAIAEVLESRHGSLWFLDAEQEALILHMTYESGQIIVGEQMRHPYASTPLFIKDVPYWPELVSTRQPIVIADIAHDSPPNRRDWLTSQGFRSLLKLPLLDHDVL
ncbi:MAG: GAF domain-containing protein, partial [Armatimonadetes bacterium]|nr:GAF domain-containing protein [Armatimonadota bacterium]